uniref:C-type lectin domain-containing protein n=1 Tax=Glossina pallidipes TaxID=7398 RepID=A0A1A9Z5C4_GLOPL
MFDTIGDIDISVTWCKANDICHTMNGYLTSIENESEMNAITEYLKTNLLNAPPWWVPGNDLASEGNYVWANTGTPMNYSPWTDGQPDNSKRSENCVHVWLYDHEYKMNDWGCRREDWHLDLVNVLYIFLINDDDN